MLDRVRSWAGVGPVTDETGRQRHLTRSEREARQRRLLYVLAAVFSIVAIVALIGGAVWQYVLVPRETYASVNGVDIRRSDYEKRRTYELLQSISRLSQQLQVAQSDQQAGLQQQLQSLQLELQDLDADNKNINPDALKGMVDDQIALQSLDDFGIVLTQQEIDDFVNELLAPIPLTDPTTTPTIEPTAAAWATQTSEAFFTGATATTEFQATQAEATVEGQQTAAALTPTSSEGESTPAGSTTPTVAPTATPAATATIDPNATPDPNAPTATATLAPTATISRDQALSTAEANFDLLDQNFLDRAGMSRGDFERLVARPALAQVKITEQLTSKLKPRQEQVRASHILVATRDAAEQLISGRLQTEDFADVAKDVSTDTGTAANGGDLGWFPRGVMTKPFEDAAFSLDVGEMTQEPVQTQFGWHIIKVTGHEQDRPLTVSMLNNLKGSVYDNWLRDQRDAADISSEVTLPADDAPPALGGA